MINLEAFQQLRAEMQAKGASLVAVSKTKPAEDIQALYEQGHRDFGENYVQELLDKEAALPKDIRWHFIGHLQSNKVKYLASFVHLIHGIDSEKLLREVDKQGRKAGRKIDVLLQVHIAREETKFGMDAAELEQAFGISTSLENIRIRGLMGMASFTDDLGLVRSEFRQLKQLYDTYREARELDVLSMGMSGDYRIALEEGSTLVRIGSLLFGARRPASTS